MEKKFKPFDKVLVRSLANPKWSCDFYSHYNVEEDTHDTVCFRTIKDENILPYEGNEHLVGTDLPADEEVRLEEGELLVYFEHIKYLGKLDLSLGKFINIDGDNIRLDISGCPLWKYAIRFSDFNPNDMEATKSKILCVKNGKIVKFKNKD